MRQAELTITLPPAKDNSNGTITARTYPLLVVAEPGIGAVSLQSVTVAPAASIIEVWVGKGALARRQVIERDAQLTQAVTDGFAPLDLTFANLSTDTATQVVVSCLVYGGAGDPFGFSEPVRFIGPYPFGTSGQQETSYDDQAATVNVTAMGAGFTAVLTTDAPTVTHSIRELVALTRILNSAGGSAITTFGSTMATIIVNANGVTVDSAAGTINVNPAGDNSFAPTDSPAGTVNLPLNYLAAGGVNGSLAQPARADHTHNSAFPGLYHLEYDAAANGTIAVSSTTGAVVGTQTIAVTMPNDGRAYVVSGRAAYSLYGSSFAYLGVSVNGTAPRYYVSTNEVNPAQRTVEDWATLTGSGQVVNVQVWAKINSGSGWVGSGQLIVKATPKPLILG